MKRLVVCADGTWNSPRQEGADGRKSTNVLKLLRAVEPSAPDGTQQVVFYDKGVGTGGPLDRILGGGLGIGLSENVLDCYRFLANNHQDGDEIYAFGFSRGAFTVRSLAGLIAVIGLVEKTNLGALRHGYAYYRLPEGERAANRHLLDELGERRSEAPITCIGVWDTVGALGIPLTLFKKIGARRFRFHDTDLGKDVAVALQALAIDERRRAFEPAIWTADSIRPHQSVEQVWFAGVHTNVGGGYPDAGLSDIALDWMIERVARHTDLAFDPRYRDQHVAPNPGGRLYDSRKGYYRLFRPVIRSMPAHTTMHDSVGKRMSLPLEPPYRPANVPA